MNTLREIGNFVGIPQGSMEVARYSQSRVLGLANIRTLLTKYGRPSSMRAIIQLLENLTPLTLEADLIGNHYGEEPFEPIVRLNACGGITFGTYLEYILNGEKALIEDQIDYVKAPHNFNINQLGPGEWQLIVKRAGISNTGFVSFSKTLPLITVSAHHQNPPPSRPPIPPANPPIISASTEGAGAGTVLIVTGSGFLPNKIVTVRVADDVFHERNFQQTSTISGELKMRISLECNSGQPFHVSATDSRNAAGILGVLFSNNVTLSCP